jgi:hypothetical protein
VINLSFQRAPHYEVIELWEGAAAQPRVLQTLEKLRLPVYFFGYESKGRTGTEFQGYRTYTNGCPFGHGEPHSRISLPVLTEDRHA